MAVEISLKGKNAIITGAGSGMGRCTALMLAEAGANILVSDINEATAAETAFVHDTFRTMGGGKPFLLMESTPSVANWHKVNKIPRPGIQGLSSIQAVAHGADSVQYFQWRKSRGGHEKFHGAVVDHCGHEHTRVFREVSHLGEVLTKLDDVIGEGCRSRVAILCDCENGWAVKNFCGYNNQARDYYGECVKWYAPFWEKGISADVISTDDDFTAYDLIIAPVLYMMKERTMGKIEEYVKNGGSFVTTYIFGIVDEDDLCYLGGFPGGCMKDVFGIWCEETDSLPAGRKNRVSYKGRSYDAVHFCDILHARGAAVLGEYNSDFYSGSPAVTVNTYGKGKAYCVAFASEGDFQKDFCASLINELDLRPDCGIVLTTGVSLRKRGDLIFVMNFSEEEKTVTLDREYQNVLTGEPISGTAAIPVCGYLILK